MGHTDLAIKLDRLKEDLGQVVMTAFEQKLTKELAKRSTIPPGMRDAIIVDLAYCVSRHRAWHQVDVFRDLLQDLLTARYKLAAVDAAPLAEVTQEVCRQVLPAPSHVIFRDCKAFLRRIFVATATATNERDLYLNLGLGPGLIQRMRASVAGMAYGPASSNSTTKIQFIPELDATFSEILLELSRCLKATSATLEYFRLFDALLITDTVWPSRLTKRCLTEALQDANPDKTKSHPVMEIYELLVELAHSGQMQGTDCEDVAEALVAAKLAMPRHGFDRSRTGKPSWQLLPLGQTIAAEGYVRQHLKGRPIAIGKLLALPETIQAYTIAHSPLRELDLIKDLVSHPTKYKRNLSPLALKAAMKYLALNLPNNEFTDLVTQAFSEHKSAWSRTAMAEEIGNLDATKEMRASTWLELAQFDPSPMVREACMACIIAANIDLAKVDLPALVAEASPQSITGTQAGI